jgi:hypothetical protein
LITYIYTENEINECRQLLPRRHYHHHHHHHHLHRAHNHLRTVINLR